MTDYQVWKDEMSVEAFREAMDELRTRRAADERREAWQTRAVEVLRKHLPEYRNDTCPVCSGMRPERYDKDKDGGWRIFVTRGHAPDCALSALLKEADK